MKKTNTVIFILALIFMNFMYFGIANATVLCTSSSNNKPIGIEFVADSCPTSSNQTMHYIETSIKCSYGNVELSGHFGDELVTPGFLLYYWATVNQYRVFGNTLGNRIVVVHPDFGSSPLDTIDGKKMSDFPGGGFYSNVFDKVLYPQAISNDADKDHYIVCDDCNDSDPSVNPGATEVCSDDKDNNCNGLIDCADQACASELACCSDEDDDGFSADGGSCGQVDCNDADPAIHPGAEEICDGKDNNCDGQTDEGLSTDSDGDGHFAPGSCNQPADDCNDSNPGIYPGGPIDCNIPPLAFPRDGCGTNVN